MISMFKIVLFMTALLTALIAGLFYSYSCSVNPGLGKLPDAAYLRAMQSINKAILNPVFFASFMGTVILLPLCTFLSYKEGGATQVFYLLLAATAIYIVGVFGVTAVGNVPLNNMLEGIDIASIPADQLSNHRKAFELPWNRYHSIRTIANIAALSLVLLSMLKLHVLPGMSKPL